jgi:hypothetical protein
MMKKLFTLSFLVLGIVAQAQVIPVGFIKPLAPTISSTTSGTITSSSAILGGVLGSTGGATTSFGILYSTSSSFTSPTTATINSNASAGTYTTTITG